MNFNMQFSPPVSIIIPCFNHGKFLLEAIKSVEKCDKRLYELIIINDGSTDSFTANLIKSLLSQGYHVIEHENSGLSAARNTGIKAAHGRYILPLDADNRISPAWNIFEPNNSLPGPGRCADLLTKSTSLYTPKTLPYRG